MAERRLAGLMPQSTQGLSRRIRRIVATSMALCGVHATVTTRVPVEPRRQQTPHLGTQDSYQRNLLIYNLLCMMLAGRDLQGNGG